MALHQDVFLLVLIVLIPETRPQGVYDEADHLAPFMGVLMDWYRSSNRGEAWVSNIDYIFLVVCYTSAAIGLAMFASMKAINKFMWLDNQLWTDFKAVTPSELKTRFDSLF